MGRKKRAELLVPSFVFVAAAAAAACGGTSMGDDSGAGGIGTKPPIGVAGYMTNPSSIGGGGYPTNPPPIADGGHTTLGGYGSGGYANPPPISNGGSETLGGYGSGGLGNTAGYMTNPPPVACPATVPVNGSACFSSTPGAYKCDYGTGDPCTTTLAWCLAGSWSLAGYAIDCSGLGGVGGGPPIAEGGAAGDGPAPDPVVYCPQTLPTVGVYCYKPSTVTSYRCDYAVACGAYEATCDGQWQLQFHGSLTDCAAGAPGN